MPPVTHTFTLGTQSERGVITLTPAGLDVLRCLLIRWISQAEKGESAAREFDRIASNPFSVNQKAYFRNAASFLTKRLYDLGHGKFNIREQLEVMTRTGEGCEIPESWTAFIAHAAQMGDNDESAISAVGGGGTGGDRVPEIDSVGDRQSGAKLPKGDQPGGRNRNPSGGGEEDGSARKGRPNRPGADHRRGGRGDEKGETA